MRDSGIDEAARVLEVGKRHIEMITFRFERLPYTLFQNGYHLNILLLVFKLALLASFLSSKIK